MKCPKCEVGELILYKETESVYNYKLTQKNKIYKRPFSVIEHDTEKDFLECDNDDCQQWFDYELDHHGRIIKNLLTKRSSL
ncbi:hypothetical protein [Virgibacillus sp. Bac332]|uniref:hypothetical protein n=1 Tax=Virgibacillus sp. Bac332 TaxID=2419842 RepID=UPI000EF48B70|nr:hypothetical protein [Virgibacillus sp. Bac332]